MDSLVKYRRAVRQLIEEVASYEPSLRPSSMRSMGIMNCSVWGGKRDTMSMIRLST